jgi:LacI family transcriptional regulator, galactose operon repressor
MDRTIGLSLEDAALLRIVEDQCQVRGLRVISGSLDPSLQGLITDGYRPKKVPAVFVDNSADDADAVVSTNVAGAASAIRHLVSHGHTRIAYLGGMRKLTSERDRHRGYRRAIGRRPGPEVHDLHDDVAAERAAIAVLRGPHPPTAIFAARSVITLGVVRALQKLGKQRSVALVGFADFARADRMGVTVVARDEARMARTAVDALFERIDGFDGPPREIRVPTTLIPRGSGELPV